MNVTYSNNVKIAIHQYAQALKNYPISKERRNDKVRMLRNYMKKSIRTVCETIGNASYPLCTFSDLGQCFDSNKRPLNQFLRQTHFSDESKTQWLISFIVFEDNNTILIENLKQAKTIVKEMTSIKESQLREVVRNAVRECLTEGLQSYMVGEWEAIYNFITFFDAKGIEDKGEIRALALYTNGSEENYWLFQRRDNLKLFYAMVVDIPNDKDGKTMWKPINRNLVPDVILRDLPRLRLCLYQNQPVPPC